MLLYMYYAQLQIVQRLHILCNMFTAAAVITAGSYHTVNLGIGGMKMRNTILFDSPIHTKHNMSAYQQ
jgi:hypothetical protein